MAAGPLHSTQTANHVLENWTYANATARTTATGFTSADLGKVAYQTDTGAYYRLTATAPTWVLVGGGSGAGFALLAAANTFTVGPQTVNTGADGNKGLVVVPTTSQVANLIEAQAPAGTPTFFVDSQARLTDKTHAAFGADSAVDADPLGFYGGTFSNVVTVEEEITDLTAGFVNGINVFLDLDPSATPQTGSPTGINTEVRTDPANGQDWTAGSFNAVVGVGATVDHKAAVFINSAIAGNFQAVNSGAGSLSFLEGLACIVQNIDALGSVGIVYGVNMGVVCIDGEITISYAGKYSNSAFGGLIDTAYGCWVQNLGAGGAIGASYGTFVDSPAGVTGNNFAHWVADQSGWGGTNCYAFWYDSPGVYRIKYDGVMGYYNPAFSPKYTPGGVDYERVVQQWNTNVLEYGLEAGGTGTQRALRLFGAGVQVAASGASGPDASAAFEVDSTTKGLAPPRGTTTQKNAISSPLESLIFYDMTLHAPYFWNGSAWTAFTSGAGTVTAVSVASANGFAGTSSGGATPALTLTTSITGLLKGNGTAISAAALTDQPGPVKLLLARNFW